MFQTRLPAYRLTLRHTPGKTARLIISAVWFRGLFNAMTIQLSVRRLARPPQTLYIQAHLAVVILWTVIGRPLVMLGIVIVQQLVIPQNKEILPALVGRGKHILAVLVVQVI